MKKILLTVAIATSFVFATAGAKANEPDPTDDGNIIVECVGAGDPSLRDMSDHAASLPGRPLGPLSCGPHERGRL